MNSPNWQIQRKAWKSVPSIVAKQVRPDVGLGMWIYFVQSCRKEWTRRFD